MEFPKNAPTNVHKIDGVLFIQWTVYVSDEASLEAAGSDGTALENAKVERQLDHLQAAETRLRKEGYHVFLDRRQKTLWVFDLSGPIAKQEVRNEERGEPASVLGSYGLKKSTFGSLRASDLADPLGPEVGELGSKGKASSRKTEGTNQQAFQANTFLEITLPLTTSQATRGGRAGTPTVSQDNAAIYQKIISAISMSICFALACDNAYVPFAPSRFLRPRSVSGKDESCITDCDFAVAKPPRAMSLNVNWLSSGTLVISSYPELGSSWVNATNVHPGLYSGPRATGVNLFVLAPLGIYALYKDSESIITSPPSVYNKNGSSSGNGDVVMPEDLAHLDRKRWKHSVAALLGCYGLEVPSQTQWSWVLISGSIAETSGINPPANLTNTILWPSHLCFQQVLDHITSFCDYSWAWERSGSNIVDPLADAESWFLGKNSRKEVLEARRCQPDLETRIRPRSPSSDGEDSLTELFMGIRRSIEQHALSGVYPTPPDANRSQVINVLTAQDLDTTETSDPSGLVDPLEESKQELADNNDLLYTSPEADMGLGEYDNLEGDDLFGDMNSDMFTANGITEADFNFFDEPARLYEGTPDVVLANEESPGYPIYTSSNVMLRESSNENQERLTNKVVGIKARPYNGTPDKATGIPFPAETPVEYKVSSLLQSPESSGNQGKAQDQSVVGDERHSSKEMDIFTIDQRQLGWKDTHYRGIPFTDLKDAFDKKYGAQGRFDTAMPSQPDDYEPKKRHDIGMEIPRLGFVAEDGDPSDTEEGEELYDEIQLYPLLGESEDQSVKDIMQHVDGNPDNTCRKRKRESSEDLNCIILESQIQQDQTSFAEYSDPCFPSLNSLLSSIEDDHQLFLSRVRLMNPSRRVTDLYSGNNQSFIQLAQVVAEQLIVLPVLQEGPLNRLTEDLVKPSKLHARHSEDPLHCILPRLFPRSEQCNLQAYLSIDENLSGLVQVSKSATKPIYRKHDVIKACQDVDKGSQDVFLIKPSNILVQRANTLMEISPTALLFWEELGLEPSAGPKNIRAMCIYPESQMMHRSVGAFLETIGCTYQRMKLGNHNRRSVANFANGLVPVRFDGSTIEETAGPLGEICERLGELLQCESDTDQPTIIYMINPFDPPKALPHLCLSFSRILEPYGYGSGSDSHSIDLVLKILPVSLLASKTTIALPPPQLYARLAMEVYDQTPQHSHQVSSSPISSNSLFQLAESVPKNLNFTLTTDPSTTLVNDDVSYHLAYSWSSDGQWLSMALTNTCGSRHCSASYCLGTIPAKWPTFRAAAQEVWDTMLELLDTRWAAFRLFIVKDSPMAQVEIDIWVTLAAQAEPNPVRIVLVTIDPSPPLYCAGGVGKHLSPLHETDYYTTPAATPIASSHAFDRNSPITNNGWSHPPRAVDGPDIDPKARLIDKTDETWGAVAARPDENNGASLALASGFLVKRVSPRDEDGVVMIGISIVYAERMSESLLKEILCMYRALGILAKARGVTTGLNLLPWHIAVARKAREGLNSTMRWAVNTVI